jgi:hypothetical protein
VVMQQPEQMELTRSQVVGQVCVAQAPHGEMTE